MRAARRNHNAEIGACEGDALLKRQPLIKAANIKAE